AAEKVVRCAGCRGRIFDRYFLFVMDKQWHSRCLRCCVCQAALESEITCFCKDGEIYCKDDYYRRFSVKRCARCHMGILASEMVMRAREAVYHLSCFTCASCGRALLTGDLYGMAGGRVYCRQHYQCEGAEQPHGEEEMEEEEEEAVAAGMEGQAESRDKAEGGSVLPGALGVERAPPKRRSRKRKEHGVRNDGGIFNSDTVCMENISIYIDRQRHCQTDRQKVKRIRTCFKNHQLQTLESYFTLKHNPDGKDWEQLSKKTGLPKRVLQVWFQNARAKLRKNVSQDENTDTDSVPEVSEQSASPPANPPLDAFSPALKSPS
uniref:LIM/homeobox protein Lhx9 n=1 Tax=Latimeria chalumnae TaxID=7897 RepID=H3B145_LATCH